MKIKYFILCSLFVACSLKANVIHESPELLSYMNFEVLNNKVNLAGFGYRKIVNSHCIDWNIAAGLPYKCYNFRKFIPVAISINYLYFFKNANTYLGAGGRFLMECSGNEFTPIVINPCLTWGFETNIKDRKIFIELKSNFLRYIKILSDNYFYRYSKHSRKLALKSHSLSVNFGTYF